MRPALLSSPHIRVAPLWKRLHTTSPHVLFPPVCEQKNTICVRLHRFRLCPLVSTKASVHRAAFYSLKTKLEAETNKHTAEDSRWKGLTRHHTWWELFFVDVHGFQISSCHSLQIVCGKVLQLKSGDLQSRCDYLQIKDESLHFKYVLHNWYLYKFCEQLR